MRRLRRRMTAVLTALLLLTLLIPWGLAEPAPGPHQTTVLFTHDLHSHFLPLERADGGESGGYARLASALEQQRALHPDALTLDGGDFSIGSLVQTLYTTRAAELRTMGALGYDGEIEGFTLIKDIPYDPVRKAYLIVGLVGRKEAPKIGTDIDKIERIY